MIDFMRRSRNLALVLAGALFLQAAPLGVAQAGMIATDARMAAGASAERAMVNGYLDRAQVRQALAAQGVDPAEAKARVATMSEREVSQLAARVEEEPAGGLFGLLLFAGLVALIVLVVADATDQADVF